MKSAARLGTWQQARTCRRYAAVPRRSGCLVSPASIDAQHSGTNSAMAITQPPAVEARTLFLHLRSMWIFLQHPFGRIDAVNIGGGLRLTTPMAAPKTHITTREVYAAGKMLARSSPQSRTYVETARYTYTHKNKSQESVRGCQSKHSLSLRTCPQMSSQQSQ
jgi:hypothetical protein